MKALQLVVLMAFEMVVLKGNKEVVVTEKRLDSIMVGLMAVLTVESMAATLAIV
jgi:hypothetical protein